MEFLTTLCALYSKKLLTCEIEKVDGLLCKLSFKTLISLHMHPLTAHVLCQALININKEF